MKSDSKKKTLSNQEMTMFCDQIAMILDAGISPMEGVSIMYDDATTEEGREILKAISDKCNEGESFYNSVESSGVFPKYALDMIEIGEKSGKLDEVMRSLAFYYNREENIAQGIKNAVTYPLLVVGMMMAVILVLIIKVLPIFNDVFKQLGAEMTGFSKGMLDFGQGISKYALVIVIVVAIIIVGLFVMSKTQAGKMMITSFASRFFATKSLYEKIASGRFASGMSLTMSAGLDTDQSLAMVSRLVDNDKMVEKIEICKEKMSDGTAFSDALNESGIFSSMYSRMINIGYKTGSVDKVLEKIANGYEQEVDDKISNMISVLEPTLVIVLSVVVCMILLSVMLPLMAVMSGIG